MEPKLGIDIGNVIMAGDNDALFGRDSGYSEERMLAIPEVPGAADAISRLVLSVFGSENVYLVSKAHKNTEAKTLRWLDYHDFWARARMRPDHARFVRERPEKRDVCLELGITHFVDDRFDVLAAMNDVVYSRYLFGPQSALCKRHGGGLRVADWAETEAAIRKDFHG